MIHCYKCCAVTMFIVLCGCAQPELGDVSTTSARTITLSPDGSKVALPDGSAIGVDLDGSSQGQSIELQATEITKPNGESLIDIDQSAVEHGLNLVVITRV